LKDRALVAVERAETEGRMLHGSNYIPISWPKLKRMLHDLFDSERASFNLSSTFETRQQGRNERIEQHTRKMLELAFRIGLSEGERKKKVMADLQQGMYDAVEMARNTLQELKAVTNKMQNMRCFLCKSIEHYKRDCPQNRNRRGAIYGRHGGSASRPISGCSVCQGPPVYDQLGPQATPRWNCRCTSPWSAPPSAYHSERGSSLSRPQPQSEGEQNQPRQAPSTVRPPSNRMHSL